jgi:predicted trehalose synthase
MSSIVVIPPMPVGDPAGMKELATLCKNVAGKIGPLGEDVAALPKQMTFEGPAGEAFAGHMQGYASRISSAAHQLQDFAGRLESAAAEVQRLIDERNALLQKLAEEQRAAVLKVLP